MESVNAGFAFLVGTEVNIIVNQAIIILESTPDYLSKENPWFWRHVLSYFRSP